MLRQIMMLVLVLITGTYVSAQKPPETEEEYKKAYEKRIQQEYLNNVYIPKDLTDAFIQLNKLIDEPSKVKFKNMSEEDAMNKLHFSLGRWMTYNWGFYGGSRLSHYIKENLEVTHPDDVSRLITLAYHRNLNRNKLDIPGLVKRFKELREQEKKERLQQGEILYEESRKRKPPRDSLPNN